MPTRSGQSYGTPSGEDIPEIPIASAPANIMATNPPKPKTRAAIDFPTVTTPADEDAATAILAINVLSTVSPWVKLYKQFCGPDASGAYSADFLTLEKFTDLFPDYFKSTCRSISFDTNLLFKEYNATEEVPDIPYEVNKLLYEFIVAVCNQRAYDVVQPFKHSDETNASSHDGRRAWLALLQEFAPKSYGETKRVLSKLQDFEFGTNKKTLNSSRSVFNELIRDLAIARGTEPTKKELWDFTVGGIRGVFFDSLITTIQFQPEAENENTNWLMKHITEFVSARTSRVTFADSNKPKPLASVITDNTPADGTVVYSRSDDDNYSKLTAAVDRLAAITSRDQVNPRITKTRGKDGKEELWTREGAKGKKNNAGGQTANPGPPCKFCPGLKHWHRNCPKLKEMEEKLEREQADEAGRLSASQGFLGGCIIVDDENSDDGGRSIIWTCCTILTILTVILMTLMRSTTSVMKASLAGLTTSTSSTFATSAITLNHYPLFMVDSGASEHICSNIAYFQEIDSTKSKQFRVVHGESIRSKGVGTIELTALNSKNEWTTFSLNNVHYLPGQPMSLLSVSRAILTGASSPNFNSSTWDLGKDTYSLLNSSGVYYLRAHAAPSARH